MNTQFALIVIMSNKNNKKWENFKRKHREKRQKKDEKLPDAVDFLTVQQLTATVEGKCQKYGGIGPLAIVPFEYDTLTRVDVSSLDKTRSNVLSLTCITCQKQLKWITVCGKRVRDKLSQAETQTAGR